MRILIITLKIGETAVGIIFERLIKGLSPFHEIDVLTADPNPSVKVPQVSQLIFTEKYNIHPRIEKLLLSAFGFNPFDLIWAFKCSRLVGKRLNKEYDIVFSFFCNHHYASIMAGNYISAKIGAKYAVHSLDAVPNPIGWSKDDKYYRKVKKLVAKYLCNVDALFSTNLQMLNYQLTTFTPTKPLVTNVIFNPSDEKIQEFPRVDSNVNYFVYTGGIYGVRKSIFLLQAFEKLLVDFPDSRLIFVATQMSSLPLFRLQHETVKKIVVAPFTSDLTPYYQCATALIDIDADIENDVFLSSKVTTYVLVNRMIICETGKNSPSRNLFENISSILLCDHDPDQLCEAMKKTIDLKTANSFDDRKDVVSLFRLQNIMHELNGSLRKVMGK